MILFDAVSKICPHRLLKYAQKLDRYIHDVPDINNTILIELMDEYFLPDFLKLAFCKGIMPNVSSWECNLRFTRIWLKEGLCYSFNLLPKDEIFRPGVEYPLAEKLNFALPKDGPERHNAEKWTDYLEEQTSPYRVSSRRDRLHVRTRAYDDFTDPTCNPDFYVFIHNPNEIPWDLQSSGYLIQIDEFVKNVLTVTPSVVRTDQSLRKTFTPEQRDCFFEDERPLKYFQKYSQSNCELECMTNASFHPEHYNCTAFWMPRTSDMPLCHMAKYVTWSVIETKATEDLKHCGCLPDCNSVNYAVTIYSSHTPYFDDTAVTKQDATDYQTDGIVLVWNRKLAEKLYLAKNKDFNFEIPLADAVKQSNDTPDFDVWKWKFSEIEVHYKDSDFLALRRHLAYSFADFVSQVGGIFGCFLGISIFSMIEIVYFCTVKMIKGVKQGEMKPEEVNQLEGRVQFIKLKPKMVSRSDKF